MDILVDLCIFTTLIQCSTTVCRNVERAIAILPPSCLNLQSPCVAQSSLQQLVSVHEFKTVFCLHSTKVYVHVVPFWTILAALANKLPAVYIT